MSSQQSVSRREFLRVAAAGTAAIGVLGQSARSFAAIEGANSRIRMGLIGCGGRGRGLLKTFTKKKDEWNCETVAVCDVYDRRNDMAKEICGGEIYKDYRKLLENKDIDAVIIGTPDHWHAKMCLDALEAGKHVYCEKPFTHTPHEALAVHKKVLQTGLKLQVGSQHTADGRFFAAKKAVEDGLIGQPVWSYAGYSRNSKGGEWNYAIEPEAQPGVNLDWDMWLGPAEKRPWDPDRFFRFRKYYDYSGGIATDLFYHKLAPYMIVFNNELPARVSAGGGIFCFHDREVPDTSFVVIDYPSKHSIVLMSSMCNDDGVPDRIRGHEATIEFLDDNQIKLVKQGAYEEEFKARHEGKDEVILTGPDCTDHQKNWLDSIREGAELHLDSARGYAAQVAISLAVYSYRQGKTLSWSESRGVYATGPDDKAGATAGLFAPAYLKKTAADSSKEKKNRYQPLVPPMQPGHRRK